MNPANALSCSRILLVPLILFPLFINIPLVQWGTAFLYLLICLTDWLDGWVARRWNMVTDLGKFLDPLADKVVVDLPLIVFTATGAVSPWPVIVIIGREFFVTGLRLLAAGEGLVIAAGMEGKIKTAVQMAAVFFLILKWPGGEALVWISAGLGVWSGWKIWKQGKVIFK